MVNFDPYNVLLAIATNIPVLLMTGFVVTETTTNNKKTEINMCLMRSANTEKNTQMSNFPICSRYSDQSSVFTSCQCCNQVNTAHR